MYRNPLEAAVWQSLMSPDGGAIFLAVIALGVMWALTYVLLEKAWMAYARNCVHYPNRPGWIRNLTWTTSGIILLVAVALHLWNLS